MPLPQGHKEMGRIILPININEYWDMFQSQEALFGVESFFQYRKFRLIEET